MLTISKGEYEQFLKIVLAMVVLILAGLFIYVLFLLRSVLFLFLSSLVFVFLLRPGVEFLSNGIIRFKNGRIIHLKVPRILSIFIVYILLFLLISFILLPTFQTLLNQANELIKNVNVSSIKNSILDWVKSLIPPESIGGLTRAVNSLFENLDKWIGTLSTTIITLITDTATAAVGWIFNAFIIFIITTFFLLDWRYINAALFSLIPRISRPNVVNLLTSVYKQIWDYVKAQLLLSMLTGTLVGLLCLVIGLRNAALIVGIVVALGEIVPYIGPLFSFSVGFLLILSSAISSGNFSVIFFYVLGFVLLEQVLAQAIAAPLLARKAKTHPLLVILTMFSFLTLFGPFAVLLAIPFLVLVKATFNYLISENKLLERLGIDLEPSYPSEDSSQLIARLRKPFTKPIRK